MRSAKSITNLALSTAVGCSFSLPKKWLPTALQKRQHFANELAAAFCVVQFFVNLCWPDDPAIPHQYETLTGEDLTAALQDVENYVKDLVAELKLDEITDSITNYITEYSGNWDKVLSADFIQKTSAGDLILNVDPTALYKFTLDNTQTAFISDMDKYFDLASVEVSAPLTIAYQRINDLRLDAPGAIGDSPLAASTQAKIFPLLLLIGSLLSGYLKAAVVWRWGCEWRRSLAWSYWIEHPKTDKPPKSALMPLWQDWRKQAGCPVNRLVDEINNLLVLCEGAPASGNQPARQGIYALVSNRFADRVVQVTNRTGQILLSTGPSLGLGPVSLNSGTVTDSKTSWSKTYLQAQAEMVFDVATGVQIASEWAYWTKQYGLDNIEQIDIDNFKGCLEQWKLNRDSVRFSEYKVRANETSWRTVALRNYDLWNFTNPKTHTWATVEDALAFLGQKIIDFNADTDTGNKVVPPLVPGDALKIPEIDPNEFRTGPNGAIMFPTGATSDVPAVDGNAFITRGFNSSQVFMQFMMTMIPDWIRPEALAPPPAPVSTSFADLILGTGAQSQTLSEEDCNLGLAFLIDDFRDMKASPLLEPAKQAIHMTAELFENWSALLSLQIDPVTHDFPNDTRTAAIVDQLNRYTAANFLSFSTTPNAAYRDPLHIVALKIRDGYGLLSMLLGTLAVSYLKLALIWKWGNCLRLGLQNRAQCPDWNSWAFQPKAMPWTLAKTCLVLNGCRGGRGFWQGSETLFDAWKLTGSHVIEHWHTVIPGQTVTDVVTKYKYYKNIKSYDDPKILSHFGYSTTGEQFLIDRIVEANSFTPHVKVLAIPCVPPPSAWLS